MKQSNNIILSIIIISYNTKELLEECINSIIKSLKDSPIINEFKNNTEIIVIDNNSTDGTKEYLLSFKRSHLGKLKTIFNKENLGFAKANNQGIKIAKGKYIMLLNSDTIILDNALEILVDYLEKNPDIAAVSPLLLNHDRTPQMDYYMKFPNLWQIFLYHNKVLRPIAMRLSFLRNKICFAPQNRPYKIDQLPGAAMMVKKDIFNQIDLLDENYSFYFEDVDWSFKAKELKLNLIVVPKAKIIHLGGGSWKKAAGEKPQVYYDKFFRSMLLFVRKNYGSKKEKIFRRAIKLNFLLKGKRLGSLLK